jgi:NTE family protein
MVGYHVGAGIGAGIAVVRARAPHFLRAVLAFNVFSLLACAHTTNVSLCPNVSSGEAQSCAYDPHHGYRFMPEGQDRDTLIVLTFSGGGIRASALAFGTLQALQRLPGLRGNGSLLDEVDIISSVSGGSVTAAWYGLKGQGGLAGDEQQNSFVRFLHEGGGGKLTWSARLLNPVAAGRFAFSEYQRSDALADFFAATLFKDADGRDFVYRDLEKEYGEGRGQLPFIMLNATDLGHETGFPFTQNRFDLICSDLSRFRVADAVAASANFPLVFSAMGIQNYSPDCARLREAETWTQSGPAQWIARYQKCDAAADDPWGARVRPPRSDGLLQLRAAREAQNYINPPAQDTVLHLLDGGLTDNLGILSTLAIEDEAKQAPGLFARLRRTGNGHSRYSKVKNVLYIVVNARSRTPAGIDSAVYPPDELSTLSRLIDTSLDATILTNQNYLTAELQAIVAPPQRTEKIDSCSGTLSYEQQLASFEARNARNIGIRIVTVDFEMVPVALCRDKFWTLGTTWSLDRNSIDDLIALPSVLLSRSLELKEFYRNAGKNEPSFAAVPRDFASVCQPTTP